MGIEIRNRYTSELILTVNCANLRNANLSNADLRNANLYGANLSDANLYDANLSYADLSYANLSNANLSYADLHHANLSNANLYDADLRNADLYGADLCNAKGLEQFRIIPEEGAFIGWKQLANGSIARLVIPHDAERCNAIGSRKCRASKAFIHEIFGDLKEVGSRRKPTFLYREGEEVVPDKYDPDIRVECSHGIHFFITRKEAEDY